ncbi:MAG: hypothetical protein JWO36_5666 [Myxococcales bacterium]|nr:hypothetical protein [Myxococcales bacterium]
MRFLLIISIALAGCGSKKSVQAPQNAAPAATERSTGSTESSPVKDDADSKPAPGGGGTAKSDPCEGGE